MTITRLVSTAAIAIGTAACTEPLPPIGQLLVHVDTDAPLAPAPGGAAAPGAPPPLFDSVRIELYAPGEVEPCAECSRTVRLDASRVREGTESFGLLAPTDVAGYVLRARLFYAPRSLELEPAPEASLDAWLELPPVPADGVLPVTAFLSTDRVAAPLGSLDAPVPASTTAAGGHEGTWAGARAVPCVGEAPPGTVCVPGGAYWMGHPANRIDVASVGTASNLQRLVVLAPFWLDRREVTVAEVRASGVARFAGQTLVDPDPWSGGDGGSNAADHCRYTLAAGPFDDLPVNCVSWLLARDHCMSRGMDLPTEAQFEYVAGALEGRLYPWGADAPLCGEAVFGLVAEGGAVLGSWECRELVGGPQGPRLPGSGTRDVVPFPDGDVVDLGANLFEWTLDRWNRQDEPCWGTGIFHEPRCEEESPADGLARVVRGGSWIFTAEQTRASLRIRRLLAGSNLGSGVGFRCARPGL